MTITRTFTDDFPGSTLNAFWYDNAGIAVSSNRMIASNGHAYGKVYTGNNLTITTQLHGQTVDAVNFYDTFTVFSMANNTDSISASYESVRNTPGSPFGQGFLKLYINGGLINQLSVADNSLNNKYIKIEYIDKSTVNIYYSSDGTNWTNWYGWTPTNFIPLTANVDFASFDGGAGYKTSYVTHFVMTGKYLPTNTIIF